MFSFAGVAVGYTADRVRRTGLLAAAVAIWSAVTVLCGFAQTFWQIALLRVLQALGESACTPLSNGEAV